MSNEEIKNWLNERTDNPRDPVVLVLAKIVRNLIARVEALENAALPPEKPEKPAKTVKTAD